MLVLSFLWGLEFTSGKQNWGYPFRFGLFEISEDDMQIIARSMHVDCLRGDKK